MDVVCSLMEEQGNACSSAIDDECGDGYSCEIHNSGIL